MFAFFHLCLVSLLISVSSIRVSLSQLQINKDEELDDDDSVLNNKGGGQPPPPTVAVEEAVEESSGSNCTAQDPTKRAFNRNSNEVVTDQPTSSSTP